MASASKKVKGYVNEVKAEKTPEQIAFNQASGLYDALKELQAQTNNKFQVLGEKIDFLGDVAIETNIPSNGLSDKHLTLRVGKTGMVPAYDISCVLSSNDGSDLITFGAKNRFAVKKAVKYVIREAKANGIKLS